METLFVNRESLGEAYMGTRMEFKAIMLDTFRLWYTELEEDVFNPTFAEYVEKNLDKCLEEFNEFMHGYKVQKLDTSECITTACSSLCVQHGKREEDFVVKRDNHHGEYRLLYADADTMVRRFYPTSEQLLSALVSAYMKDTWDEACGALFRM
jgi:hypothetical protein